MNLYLQVRDDTVVTGCYFAESQRNDADVEHVDNYDGTMSEEEFAVWLEITNENGWYMNKHNGRAFIRMSDEEIYDANVSDIEKELAEIERWYADTDYISLKVVRGNWKITDQRYLDYLAEYEMKHARAEEIKEELYAP